MESAPLILQQTIRKYESIHTDIDDYDSSSLTSTAKMMFKQWEMDPDDNLLVDGYYRKCNLIPYELSSDIKQIIISFYVKQYSKGSLNQKLKQIKIHKQRKWELRKARCQQHVIRFCIWLFIIFICLFFVGTDIASLIVINENNCHNFGVHQFLLVGSIINLVALPIVVFSSCIPCLFVVLGACTIVFSVTWSFKGFILYSEIDTNIMSNNTCSNMILSWSIHKFVLYSSIIVFHCIVSGTHRRTGRFIVSGTEAYRYKMGWIGVMSYVIMFPSDIVGFTIAHAGKDDCDAGNEILNIGIYEYLIIGCSLHIVTVAAMICVHVYASSRGEPYLIPTFVLFFIFWGTFGCILYGMNVNVMEYKQCDRMTISWIVLRFIEIIWMLCLRKCLS